MTDAPLARGGFGSAPAGHEKSIGCAHPRPALYP